MNLELDLTFPPVPQNADKSIIKPSKAFKQKVFTSVLSILFFVITYLFLFAAAIAIAVAFGVLGYTVMTAAASFITLVFGAACIGAGLLLVYFVVKFLFKRTKVDRTGMIEVTEAEQPRLFAFIRRLTHEMNAPFPKHIYISADVNAAVFYDSNFWSMFLPVRKNLKIGLGLVNSINISEFKAVMAHEFGHFSQRSMKFGSYVYNVNKVIYNMLYDNDSYGRLLSSMSQLHSIFFLAAKLNVWIIRGMQAVLGKVYVIINKNYMGLSRQTEFHADAMAAYVAGSNHGITCLRRVEIGQQHYDELLNYWGGQLEQKKRADNFYPQHLELIRNYAGNKNIPTDVLGLPVLDNNTPLTKNSRIVLQDQWSSHPTTEDRELHFNKINLVTPAIEHTAWLLFTDAELLQQRLTDNIYASSQIAPDARRVGLEEFSKEMRENITRYELPAVFKGYYDQRYINEFDIDDAITEADTFDTTWDDLLNGENAALPDTIAGLAADSSLFDTIISVRKDIKTFDFDGTRYKRDKAAGLQEKIEKDKEEAIKKMQILDEQIFIYFYKAARTTEEKDKLKDLYRGLFNFLRESTADFDLYGNVAAKFTELNNTQSIAVVDRIVAEIYKMERPLRTRMQEAIADEAAKPFFTEEALSAIDNYVSNKWVYFHEPTFDNSAIKAFYDGTNAFVEALSERNFKAKKELLSYQAELLSAV